MNLQELREACQKGRKGLDHVLAKMAKAIAAPRPCFKSSVPIMEEIVLPQNYKMAVLFRSGAYNAKLILAEFGVQVIADGEDKVVLLAPDQGKMESARKFIDE